MTSFCGGDNDEDETGPKPEDLRDEAWRVANQWLGRHGTSRGGFTHNNVITLAAMIDFWMGHEAQRVTEWVFALVGMGLAIQANAPRLVERSYWTSDIDGARYYDCGCPGEGCGVHMKRCKAGEDEGTDNEYCGLCRY